MSQQDRVPEVSVPLGAGRTKLNEGQDPFLAQVPHSLDIFPEGPKTPPGEEAALPHNIYLPPGQEPPRRHVVTHAPSPTNLAAALPPGYVSPDVSGFRPVAFVSQASSDFGQGRAHAPTPTPTQTHTQPRVSQAQRQQQAQQGHSHTGRNEAVDFESEFPAVDFQKMAQEKNRLLKGAPQSHSTSSGMPLPERESVGKREEPARPLAPNMEWAAQHQTPDPNLEQSPPEPQVPSPVQPQPLVNTAPRPAEIFTGNPPDAVRNYEDPMPPGYQRIGLPSDYIFYKEGSLGIRPLTPGEVVDLTTAAQVQDLDFFRDILDKTITMDIRKLWVGDYRWVLLWHRHNSFEEVPLRMTWESVYGNTQTTSVLPYTECSKLSLGREKYEREFAAHGLEPLTVGALGMATEIDAKRALGEGGPAEKACAQGRWSRAQFVRGLSFAEKMGNFEHLLNRSDGKEVLRKIQELESLVLEPPARDFALVKDALFDPAKTHKYEEKLKERKLALEEALAMGAGDILAEKTIQPLLARIEEALAALEAGEAGPVPETIAIDIEELSFFPRL